MRAVGVHGNGVTAIELHAKIFRACSCGEPNPSMVDCPSCGVLNYSGHSCRSCGGPGGAPNVHWSTCPACGRAARIEDVGVLTAWYRNPLRQLVQKLREWRRARRLQRA